MNRWFLLAGFLLMTCWASAHNPNTTAVTFRPENGIWTAHFVISQQGANYALATYYATRDLGEVSIEEYKKLYLDYVKAHCQLIVDGTPVHFGSAGIRLGSHQTDIRLLIEDFPATFHQVELTLNAFEENENQHTVARFQNQAKDFRKVLSRKNGFSTRFENREEAFVAYQAKVSSRPGYYRFGLIILFLGVALYQLGRKFGSKDLAQPDLK